MSNTYNDIISLAHKQSDKRKRMPVSDRAAQFAPFSALTGYEAAIKESERRTEEKLQLSDTAAEQLDNKLSMLRKHLADQPEVTITFYRPDEKKSGGTYCCMTGKLERIDTFAGLLILQGNQRIRIEDLTQLDSPFLPFDMP